MILEFDRPLSLGSSTARFNRWGPDPVNVAIDGTYHRVIRTDSGPVPYRARQVTPIRIEVDGPNEAEADLRWRLAEALAWGPVTERATADDRVAALLTNRMEYRPPMEPDPFESLVHAITAQQVNLQWATTTRRRLVETFAEPIDAYGLQLRPFPTPDVLAAVQPADLRELQFTWRKSEFIIGLAQHALAGELADLPSLTNVAVIERLTAFRGIGRWSAEWLLARCLARPDVIAAGDLGVRKAVSFHWVGSSEVLTESTVRTVTQDWGNATNWITHLLLEQLADS